MKNPQESDLALLFKDLSHNEKPFEIKPPLVKTLSEPHCTVSLVSIWEKNLPTLSNEKNVTVTSDLH